MRLKICLEGKYPNIKPYWRLVFAMIILSCSVSAAVAFGAITMENDDKIMEMPCSILLWMS